DHLGVRDLSSDEERCAALNDPLALAIALMIDPDANVTAAPSADATSTPAPTQRPLPPPPPPTLPAPQLVPASQPPPPARAPHPQPTWRSAVEVGPLIQLGLLPDVSFGVGAAVFVEPPSFVGVQAYATRWLPNDAEVRPGIGATIQLMEVGAAVCPLSTRPGR